jgi:fibronectin-binding autotransporter adhesin
MKDRFAPVLGIALVVGCIVVGFMWGGADLSKMRFLTLGPENASGGRWSSIPAAANNTDRGTTTGTGPGGSGASASTNGSSTLSPMLNRAQQTGGTLALIDRTFSNDATAANKTVTAGNDTGSGINSGGATGGAGQASGSGTGSSGTTLSGGASKAVTAAGGIKGKPTLPVTSTPPPTTAVVAQPVSTGTGASQASGNGTVSSATTLTGESSAGAADNGITASSGVPTGTTATTAGRGLTLAPDASRTWNNTGTDFNSGGSWMGGVVPGAGDVAVFNVARVTNPNLSASLTIQELNFSTAASSGYDLTSSTTSIKLTLTNIGTGATSAINAANTSGTNTIDAPLILGASTGSTQTFTQASGGTLVVNGIISGTINTLALTGGGTGNFTFTGANTFTAAITLDGGTLKLGSATALGATANTITVGNNTTATLDLNGQSIANAVTIVGSGIGGNGALINSSGTAATLSGTLDGSNTPTIGGTGNITISGQIIAMGSSALTKVGSGTVFITNNTNTYTRPTDIVGGVINIQAANALGNTSSGTTVESGAALQIQGGITTAAEGLTLNGTGVSNDGALRNILNNNTYAGAIVLGSASRINSDAGTLTLSGGITGAFALTIGGAGNTTVSSVIGPGAGTVTKDGAGTLTLSGANTYTGTTTVSGGTLLVNNTSGSGTGTGAVTVNNSGTTLGGTGTISGTVTVNAAANIAPGNGGNTTAILQTGALTLAATSNFRVDINGTTVGTGYDRLQVNTGAVAITSSNLVVTVGTTLSVGQTFLILDKVAAGAITGTFAGIPQGGTVVGSNGTVFSVSYIGGNGNDIVLTVTSAVPEPGTWIGGALALAALVLMQRRRLKLLLPRLRRS